jgi:hypothetical protein
MKARDMEGLRGSRAAPWWVVQEGVSSIMKMRFCVSKITGEQILGTTKIFGALFKTILLDEGQKKKRKE